MYIAQTIYNLHVYYIEYIKAVQLYYMKVVLCTNVLAPLSSVQQRNRRQQTILFFQYSLQHVICWPRYQMSVFILYIRKISSKIQQSNFPPFSSNFPPFSPNFPPNLYLKFQYELRLVASDNLNENYTTVVIHVNDVNDNPPVFDRPTYETQITEEDDRNLPKRVLEVNTACRRVPFQFGLVSYVHPFLVTPFVLFLFVLFIFSMFLFLFSTSQKQWHRTV